MYQNRPMIRTLLLALFVAFLFCRCASSKKFDYHSAYKFKYTRHVTSEDKQSDLLKLEPRWDEYYALAEEKSGMETHLTIHEFESPTMEQPEVNASPVGAKESRISKKEKKELKAEIKSIIKSIRRNDIQKKEKATDYRNTPPAFKGFIFAIIGFGVILLSVLINVEALSAILLVVGFIIIGYGLLKILMNR